MKNECRSSWVQFFLSIRLDGHAECAGARSAYYQNHAGGKFDRLEAVVLLHGRVAVPLTVKSFSPSQLMTSGSGVFTPSMRLTPFDSLKVFFARPVVPGSLSPFHHSRLSGGPVRTIPWPSNNSFIAFVCSLV